MYSPLVNHSLIPALTPYTVINNTRKCVCANCSSPTVRTRLLKAGATLGISVLATVRWWKLQCCWPARVEQFTTAPTRHELCAFQASTENISILVLSQPWRIV